jgi:hypothetical protein
MKLNHYPHQTSKITTYDNVTFVALYWNPFLMEYAHTQKPFGN